MPGTSETATESAEGAEGAREVSSASEPGGRFPAGFALRRGGPERGGGAGRRKGIGRRGAGPDAGERREGRSEGEDEDDGMRSAALECGTPSLAGPEAAGYRAPGPCEDGPGRPGTAQWVTCSFWRTASTASWMWAWRTSAEAFRSSGRAAYSRYRSLYPVPPITSMTSVPASKKLGFLTLV